MRIIDSILTRNPCYRTGKKIAVKGLMLHSVGCNQPDATVFVNGWNSPGQRRACVHGFIDALNDDLVYQTLPWDHKGWHAGEPANSTHIGVEMCEPACIKYTGKGANFNCYDTGFAITTIQRTYNTAVKLFAMLCKEYHLDPKGDGVILSHKEGSLRGISTRHADPEHLWIGLNTGYTMDKFRDDVAKAMDVKKEAEIESHIQAVEFASLSNDDIIKRVGPLFTKDYNRTGILASVSLAQFILESGYGKSDLAQKANNCFGMKVDLSNNTWEGSTWDGKSIYSKKTREYRKGRYYDEKANFRMYESVEKSIADHSAYLLGAKSGGVLRYNGLKNCTDYVRAVRIIRNGGYATSPTYITRICNIIEGKNLTQYDKIESTPAQEGIDFDVEYIKPLPTPEVPRVPIDINSLSYHKGPGLNYSLEFYIKHLQPPYFTECLSNILSFEADDTILSFKLQSFNGKLGDLIFAMNTDFGGIIVDVKKDIETKQYYVECRNLICYLRERIYLNYSVPESSIETTLEWFIHDFIDNFNRDGLIRINVDSSYMPHRKIRLNNDLHNIRNNHNLTIFEFVEHQIHNENYIFRLEYQPQHIILKIRPKNTIPPSFKKTNIEWFLMPKIVVVLNTFFVSGQEILIKRSDVNIRRTPGYWPTTQQHKIPKKNRAKLGQKPIVKPKKKTKKKIRKKKTVNKVSYTIIPGRDGKDKLFPNDIIGKIEPGLWLITETKSAEGSKNGWGKLKDGRGWVSLDFATFTDKNPIDFSPDRHMKTLVIFKNAFSYSVRHEWNTGLAEDYKKLYHEYLRHNVLAFNKYYQYESIHEWNKDFERIILKDIQEFVRGKYEEYHNQFKRRRTFFKNQPTTLDRDNKFVMGVVDLNEVESKMNICNGDNITFFDGENKVVMEVKNRYIKYDKDHGLTTKLMFNNN